MPFSHPVYDYTDQRESAFAYLHSYEYEEALDHCSDIEDCPEFSIETAQQTEDQVVEEGVPTSSDEDAQPLNKDQVKAVHRAWANVYATVLDILARLADPDHNLASPYPHLFRTEMWIIRQNLEPLKNAIEAIDLEILDSYDYAVIEFKGTFAAMLPLLQNFASNIIRANERYDEDPYILCCAYRNIFERYERRMDGTHRTEPNAILHDLRIKLREGEREDYKTILDLFHEIWATLRQLFYDFRLMISSDMYSGPRPPPDFES